MRRTILAVHPDFRIEVERIQRELKAQCNMDIPITEITRALSSPIREIKINLQIDNSKRKKRNFIIELP